MALLTPGTRVRQYQILTPLGAGGMGEVCLAQDTRLERKVAVKLLGEEFNRSEDRLRAYAGLTKIAKIQVVSPPPGPLATALVAFKLPDSINSGAFRDLLLKKYGIVIKIAGQINGIRISPHIFNTEAEI